MKEEVRRKRTRRHPARPTLSEWVTWWREGRDAIEHQLVLLLSYNASEGRRGKRAHPARRVAASAYDVLRARRPRTRPLLILVGALQFRTRYPISLLSVRETTGCPAAPQPHMSPGVVTARSSPPWATTAQPASGTQKSPSNCVRPSPSQVLPRTWTVYPGIRYIQSYLLPPAKVTSEYCSGTRDVRDIKRWYSAKLTEI